MVLTHPLPLCCTPSFGAIGSGVASTLVRLIVEELDVPYAAKTIKPVTDAVGGMAGGDKYIHKVR